MPKKKQKPPWLRTDVLFLPDETIQIEEASSHKKAARSVGSFVDDGKQATFTVAQVASLWSLSADTIQRLFENEPGVITLGNKNPRGKRRRITLRIPRAVMERVKKRRSNPA